MKPTIIEPVKAADHYEWAGLEVRRSNEADAGSGVFARVNLRAGLMVPILGIEYIMVCFKVWNKPYN